MKMSVYEAICDMKKSIQEVKEDLPKLTPENIVKLIDLLDASISIIGQLDCELRELQEDFRNMKSGTTSFDGY